MKLAALIVGVLLMILAGLTAIVCLALPSMTNNRVSFEESMLGLIPAVVVFLLAFVMTVISAFLYFKTKKPAV